MMRWSLLAIAFAIGACGDGERDRTSGDASEVAADAGSAVPADTGSLETGAASGTESAAAAAGDTGKVSTATDPGTGTPRGPTGAEAMGGTRGTNASVDLTPDRVRQLQSALNDGGCDAGPVDGIVGPQTRRAIDCGLEKHGLGPGDRDGLYRALNLNL